MTDTVTGYTETEIVLRDTPRTSKRYPNYECDKCAYSTIFKAKIEDHIAKNIHVWGAPGKPGVSEEEVQVVDAEKAPSY